MKKVLMLLVALVLVALPLKSTNTTVYLDGDGHDFGSTFEIKNDSALLDSLDSLTIIANMNDYNYFLNIPIRFRFNVATDKLRPRVRVKVYTAHDNNSGDYDSIMFIDTAWTHGCSCAWKDTIIPKSEHPGSFMKFLLYGLQANSAYCYTRMTFDLRRGGI